MIFFKRSIWYCYGTFIGESITRDTKSATGQALRQDLSHKIFFKKSIIFFAFCQVGDRGVDHVLPDFGHQLRGDPQGVPHNAILHQANQQPERRAKHFQFPT